MYGYWNYRRRLERAPETPDELFEYLKECGYEQRWAGGGGDCFFHAVAMCLNLNPKYLFKGQKVTGALLRSKVCDFQLARFDKLCRYIDVANLYVLSELHSLYDSDVRGELKRTPEHLAEFENAKNYFGVERFVTQLNAAMEITTMCTNAVSGIGQDAVHADGGVHLENYVVGDSIYRDGDNQARKKKISKSGQEMVLRICRNSINAMRKGGLNADSWVVPAMAQMLEVTICVQQIERQLIYPHDRDAIMLFNSATWLEPEDGGVISVFFTVERVHYDAIIPYPGKTTAQFVANGPMRQAERKAMIAMKPQIEKSILRLLGCV